MSAEINNSDLKLFEALQAKHPAALESLYDRYANSMYSLALYILKNPEEAEDLIHGIFLSQWKSSTYNPNRGSFKTYLLLLVRCRALDRLKTRQGRLNILYRNGQQLLSGSGEKCSVYDTVEANELRARVRKAIADLPQTQSQAIMMAFFEGYSQLEIAEKLEVPLGTVKSWFRLGFAKLRRSLDDLLDQ